MDCFSLLLTSAAGNITSAPDSTVFVAKRLLTHGIDCCQREVQEERRVGASMAGARVQRMEVGRRQDLVQLTRGLLMHNTSFVMSKFSPSAGKPEAETKRWGAWLGFLASRPLQLPLAVLCVCGLRARADVYLEQNG
jgi:hypothetical protein